MNTKIQKIKELNKSYESIIKDILNTIPNKNSLYRKINLPINYLNLKSFLNGKERLKEKSERHLLNALNLEKICLYVDLNELNETEINVLENLYRKMFSKFENFAEEFKTEKRKSSPKDITKSDLEKVNELIKDVSNFKINDNSKFLDEDLFNPENILNEMDKNEEINEVDDKTNDTNSETEDEIFINL